MDVKSVGFSNSNQNFCATPLYRFNVREKIPFTPFYKRVNAQFVKLDPADLPAISRYYSNRSTSGIASDFYVSMRYHEPNVDFFAMTLQQDNCRILDSKKIIGIGSCAIYHSENTKRNRLFVSLLDTMSSKNKNAKFEEKEINFFGLKLKSKINYKKTGKKILKGFVYWGTKANIDGMQLRSLESAEDFYAKKMKFSEIRSENQQPFELKTFFLPCERFKNITRD